MAYEAVRVDDDEIAAAARAHVVRWNQLFNGNHAVPSRAQIESLRVALDSADVDEQTRRDIRLTLSPLSGR